MSTPPQSAAVIRGHGGWPVSVVCSCGERMSWQQLIDSEDRCRRCGFDWQHTDQGFGEPLSVTPVVAEVVGFRDVNGNDFAIDAEGNVTTIPLDFNRLMKVTEKR